ncbi:MAG: glutamine--fructose-6-phosphate transaminase (isomerizing) [Elusimicrobiota bacterium]
MCGIIGYVGGRTADRVLVDGLKRLEYRGYDSAGIAVIENDELFVKRSVGKLINLEEVLSHESLSSGIGLGHTRWATHGKPSWENAHPHTDCSGRIVVVHNGIIENYLGLLKSLQKKHSFDSETDTEIIAHLIENYYYANIKARKNEPLLKAVQSAVAKLEGSYALGVICADDPHTIVAARRSSPLIIGVGKKESFLASDVPAVLSYTNKIIALDDDETALLKENEISIFDKNNKKINKKITTISWDPVLAEKGGYKHFMLKEIHEQPEILRDTMRGRIDINKADVFLENVTFNDKEINSIKKIIILACGTSYHAALVGKFVIEEWAGVPCEVDIGSEFRYRHHILDKDVLVIAISQSGETADTIASFKAAKKSKVKNLVICNVVDSSIAREADNIIYTRCGPEIGVASTKALSGQLLALYLFGIYLGRRKKYMTKNKSREILEALMRIPRQVERVLKQSPAEIEKWAKAFFKKQSFLYIGRNINYPIALEGALKLKEISYIHAEGYPAGEMKHGPIALIDENMPVLAIATESRVYEKVLGNISEARARDGIILALATKGDKIIGQKVQYVCYMPKTIEALSPLINIVPLQLIAYYIAERRGCDVDQPRNLAKSVTVE